MRARRPTARRRKGAAAVDPPPADDQAGYGRGGVGRSTAIFALWTAVSRIAGLAREIVAAALFGTKGSINAFVIAFQLPGLLRNLVADSALSAAFVPVFTELQEKGRHREARELAGALIGTVVFLLGTVSLAAVLAAPWLVPLFAPGLPPDLVATAVDLAQLMFPIVVLLGVIGLFEAILQTGGQFGAPAFGPVLWNLVIIGCLAASPFFLDGDDLIFGYAAGVLAGTVVQLLFLLPWLRGKGPFPLSLGLRNTHVRRVLLLMLPVTLSLGLINLNLSIDMIFATLVSDEAPRAIDAAFRLYVLPQGVFSVAIATVLFPLLARQAARADLDGMNATIADGLRQIAFMLLPASAFLLVLAEPVVRLVFEHGEFGPDSTDLTHQALIFFAIGLAFNGASLLLIRAFFSLQESWLPTKVALLGLALNAGLDAALYKPLGVGGIPLATSLSSAATCLLLVILLKRRLGGLPVREVAGGLTRSLVASAVSAGCAWAAWSVVDHLLGRSLPAQLASMATSALCATVAYVVVARLLRMRELDAISGIVRARLGRT